MNGENQTETEVTSEDFARLRLLARLYYMLFGVLALAACYPLRYTFIGFCLLFAPDWVENHTDMDGPVGLALIIFSLLFVGIGWICAFPIFLAGRGLARQRQYGICRVVGLALYLLFPVGTVLAVLTSNVLTKPAVKRLFLADPIEPAADAESP